jgi:hypothetical protein
MAYATLADLAEYLCVEVGALPDSSARLLLRAEELIEAVIYENYDSTNTDHLAAVQRATCAQVEHWQSVGEEEVFRGRIVSKSVGRTSVSYAQTQSAGNVLCERARAALNRYGLLYAGASLK